MVSVHSDDDDGDGDGGGGDYEDDDDVMMMMTMIRRYILWTEPFIGNKIRTGDLKIKTYKLYQLIYLDCNK